MPTTTDLQESIRGYVGVRNYLFLGRLFFEVPNGNNFVSGEPNIFDDEAIGTTNELSRRVEISTSIDEYLI